MAINKYCNLYGENKISEDYNKINTGFAAVETDITQVLTSEVDRNTAETQREVNEVNRQLRYSNTKHYGEYVDNFVYHTNNIVSKNGSSYMLKEAPDGSILESQGNPPPDYPLDENDYWRLIGKKGDKGDTGAVPNIQVGTVTTLMPGNPVTVTRQTGSLNETPVFDFAIPRGQDGNGVGDMLKSDYDSNNDGTVNDSDKLGGQTSEYYSKSADFNSHLFDIAQNSFKIIRSNDGKYNSWPVIAKAPNGDILVFYNKGSQHVNGDPTRAVVYKRSNDLGMTWSDEVPILNDTYDDAIFSVCTTSAGTIIVIIRRVISSTENYDQVVMRSTDNGDTWSAPVPISVLPVSTISVSPIIEVEGHGLMASFNDRPYSCELIWSTDDGVTWGNRQTITTPADPNDAPLECRFVYIGNGKIFGIGRTNVEGAGLFQLKSEDYGATWTILRTNITDHYMTQTDDLSKQRG
jgi:hypothetical protein